MLPFTRTLICLSLVLWHCWLGGRKGIRPVKKTECWDAGVVICLERGADLHMAQLMPLPLTVSCFRKIQIGFTFPVPAHLRSPRKMAVKRVCVCVCFRLQRIVSKGSSGMQNMATFAALCPCAYKFGHKNKYLLTTCPAMDRDKTGVASVVSMLL